MATSTKLEKLTIEAYGDPGFGKQLGEPFKMQINPSTLKYSFFQTPTAQNVLASGKSVSDPKPNDYNQVLSFAFYLDATGVVEGCDSVLNAVMQLRQVCAEVDGSIHTPPYLKVLWGEQEPFTCTLRTMDIEYGPMAPDGTPVRAFVDISFNRYVDPSTKASEENNNSPDLTHVYTFMAGDNLPRLCKQVYGDTKYYIEVAKANGIINFLSIPAGKKIVFPPLRR
ncbi:hypothetical protein FUAX_24500 [Fulvitalea axinellae]|uniref:LysM domain-containing protein n=1 Tax=Fulvitalea axinellae TaxID=1182444 RepID=A0AAU9CIV4_9BACT|nr:hypothetical protein FUAX_24500 [Fulvitalea axinellae]